MHEMLSKFAQTWGLGLFVMMFATALVYALWPRNQEKFDSAARTPLDETDAPTTNGANGD